MIETLTAWNREMSIRLGMPEPVDEDLTDAFLALTGAAAHEVVRPAAPFAAMFAGWLYGSGRADSLEEAAAMVGEELRALGSAETPTAPGTATTEGASGTGS